MYVCAYMFVCVCMCVCAWMFCADCQNHLYADDTVLYSSSSDMSWKFNTLQSNFNLVQIWFSSNKLLLNKKKSYNMLFCTRPDPLLVIGLLDGTTIEKIEEFKYLGLWLDSQLSFKPHSNSITKKNVGCLKSLYRSVDCFSQEVRKIMIPNVGLCWCCLWYHLWIKSPSS